MHNVSQDAVQDATARDLVVSRLFDAPVEVVWQVWTEPELVKRWWGPNHFTAPVAEIDFREGGVSLVCMRPPQEYGGQDMYSTWTYTKIEPLRRIEYIQNMADADGKRVDPSTLGLPADFPEDVRTVVTFEPRGTQTAMTITQYGMLLGSMDENAKLGLNQCLDKMAEIFAAA